jgi:hypothetical protein
MNQRTKVLILLFVSALVRPRFTSTAAGADCMVECMQSSQMISGMTYDHKYELCQIRCKGQTAPPSYGAIAYSRKDMHWGVTYDQKDKATAENLALQYCVKQGGAKCLIEASFYSVCGAIAAAGDLVTWGTSGTKYNAEQIAVSQCTRLGGKNCAAQASICSSPNVSGASSLKSAPTPSVVSWGAIAYSTADMGAGFSQGKGDRASAEKEAMTVCAQRGKACVLRTAFNKQCGALAADRNFAGWGASADQREAQQKAIDDCKKAGGARCVLHISFCSM